MEVTFGVVVFLVATFAILAFSVYAARVLRPGIEEVMLGRELARRQVEEANTRAVCPMPDIEWAMAH